MANKYIQHGETYCGDGTTSAAATSNGGVGAWNNINVFTGTAPAYGALAAGDTVYIRSKNAAGADITVSNAATINLGSAAATEVSPVNWVIDAGVVWSGVSGTVQYTMTGTSSGVTLRNYNNLIASNYNLILLSSVAVYSNNAFFTSNSGSTKEIKIDCSANTTNVAGPHQMMNGGTHLNIWIKVGAITYFCLGPGLNGNADVTLIAPLIEIAGPLYFAPAATAVFGFGSYTQNFKVYGGEVKTSISGLALVTVGSSVGSYAGSMNLFGLKYPSTMIVSNAALFSLRSAVTVDGGDGVLGSSYFDYFYTYTSRHDGNYPTLNATLELSANAPWSYSVYPYRTNTQNPAMVAVSKIWTQAPAIKTVTVELLWPQSMAAPASDKVYAVVSYTDSATGNKKQVCSQAFPPAALSSSTAGWSATTYGPTSFDKYKIALITPTSIKKDTEVIVTLFSSPMSASPNDIIIVCPDPVFT